MAERPPPVRAERQRDRNATEERILAAVGQVLARDGFGAIGVNTVAREAGVDKVLIYRYFGGLPELLQAWGSSGRFWPSVDELLGEDADATRALPGAERFAVFFERFIDALRVRPLTIEILAAEIVERNELTAILETEREQWGQQAEALIAGDDLARNPHWHGIALIVLAGVQYLLVRSRSIRVFGGVPLRSDEGWQTLKASIREMALRLAAPGQAPAARNTATTRRQRSVNDTR